MFTGVEVQADNRTSRAIYPSNTLSINFFSTGEIGVKLPDDNSGELVAAKDVIAFDNLQTALAWARSIQGNITP